MKAENLMVGDKIRLFGYPDPLRITDMRELFNPHTKDEGRLFRLNNYLTLYTKKATEIEVVERAEL